MTLADDDNLHIPQPAHPTERHQRLPGDCESPEEAKEGRKRRAESIRHSPSYRTAIEDAAFLHGNDARGVRLQLDYLKPEMLMRQHGVEDTIVVFGGTRVAEEGVSAAKVAELERLLEAKPDDEDLQRRLDVARRVLEKSRYYEVARELSALVARCGEGPGDSRLVVMTGGGPGIMEAANRGSTEAGAKTIGLNITLPREQLPNPYLTPDLCFQFNYFAIRKLHFMLRARALVAFPGGYGTLDELFETLTLIQTRKIKPLPVVLVGEAFWRKLINFDYLVDEGVIDPEDRELFWYAETAGEIWHGINLWYQRTGSSLVHDDKG